MEHNLSQKCLLHTFVTNAANHPFHLHIFWNSKLEPVLIQTRIRVSNQPVEKSYDSIYRFVCDKGLVILMH